MSEDAREHARQIAEEVAGALRQGIYEEERRKAAEKNAHEVMQIICDRVATTAAEISHVSGIQIHDVIDSCKLLAERGEIVARMRQDTMDYAVCLTKHPNTKVFEFLDKRGAAPLLEIAALTNLSPEQVEDAVKSLEQNKLVRIKDVGADMIVTRRSKDGGVPLFVWGIGFIAAAGLFALRGEFFQAATLFVFGALALAASYWEF
jgi:hypothetical protein